MAAIAAQAFIMLFVTIGPLDVAPLFVALTPGADTAERRRMALKATAIAAVVLLAFAIGGQTLMDALGIGFPAFRIAGGILLLLLSVDMVFARQTGLSSITRSEKQAAGRDVDISVFPLAIPLIAGPGAMTAVVLLMGAHGGRPLAQATILGVLLGVLALNLILLLAAGQIVRLLGVTGINVVARVSGIILAALAAQFILDGIAASGLLG